MKSFSSNEERIERELDGLLSPEESAALKADIVRDPELRAVYIERLWLHSTLKAEGESLPGIFSACPAASDRVVRRWPMAVLAAAAAACVTLVVSNLISANGTLERRPVATLVQAENCKWGGSDLPTAVNSQLGAGTLALVEGIATLKFNSGATVTIEAPTKLEIKDAMHCRLIEGSLVADVPTPAHGFTIKTADLEVVDLGTKFGVTAGSAGNSQVRVFEGEVEIGGLASGERKRLTEGKGLHIGSGNTAVGQEPSRGQPMQREDGWTAISTAYGHGRDGYVRRGDQHGSTGLHPLLMVKHSDLPASRSNERRAFLTFDVSQAAPGKVSEAQLVLDPEPSGFGFSALVPDSRFALYAITDEALDDWTENKLLWTNAPGCSENGPTEAQTRKLAEFWIPRGGSGESLTIRGDTLADFIRQDTNGLVSFILVRETGESDPSGLVHAFASKEHPTARPPTLRVK